MKKVRTLQRDLTIHYVITYEESAKKVAVKLLEELIDAHEDLIINNKKIEEMVVIETKDYFNLDVSEDEIQDHNYTDVVKAFLMTLQRSNLLEVSTREEDLYKDVIPEEYTRGEEQNKQT